MSPIYRNATKKEAAAIAALSSQAFGEYPFYDVVLRSKFSTQQDYLAFTEALHQVHIKTFIAKQECLIGVCQEQIVSVALLHNPARKAVGLWDFIRSGGITLVPKVGLSRLLNLLELEEKAQKEVKKGYPNAWYLELLAVDITSHGKRLGSDMLQKGVIPFVKKMKGRCISLITNTQGNKEFYEKCGFEEIAQTKMVAKEGALLTWSFVKEL